MKGTFRHECPCSEQTYWDSVARDEEFGRRLFVDELGFESWKVESTRDLGGQLRRIVVAVPRMDERIPRGFRKYLRRGLTFRETDLFDPTTRVATATIVPSSASRRIAINVRLSTQPLDDTRCECAFEVDVTASLFAALGGSSQYGIGGIVEGDILNRFLEGCEVRADFTRRFLEEKGLTGR